MATPCTSAFVTRTLFDEQAGRLRRKRAMRLGGDRFLHDRAFDDCMDRLVDVGTDFNTALIVGWPNPRWQEALKAIVPHVALGDLSSSEEIESREFDLCISIGQLESVNDVQAAAFALRHLLKPGGLLIGAIVGGTSLPRLRAAMLAADRIDGGASPRLHPAIDGPSLAALLVSVGFVEPVIDVDRVDVSYPSLDRLVDDLRTMACTNILADRSRRPISRRALSIARSAFLEGNHAIERFELLHFAAWVPNI